MKRVETLQCEVSLVKSVQDKMADLLIKAPFLSAEEEQALLHRYIDLLRTRSEEMIIFIQVMLKVKQELAYARLDFERSITSNTGVNECRKRVAWLSERLKKLSRMCHNYFYDIQKEISKESISTNGSSKISQIAYDTCICGMMKKSMEEKTLDDVQSSVKKVLQASSELLVCRPGSSFQKVYKEPSSPTYDTEPLCNQQGQNLIDDEKAVEEQVKCSEKTWNALPSHSQAFSQPEDTFENVKNVIDDEQISEDQVKDGRKTLNPLSFHSLTFSQSEGTSKKDDDSLSAIGIPRNAKSKLDSLINYQNRAVDQLVQNLNNLYVHMDATPTVTSTPKVSIDSSIIDKGKTKKASVEVSEISGSSLQIKADRQQSESTSSGYNNAESVQDQSSDVDVYSSMLIPVQVKEDDAHLRKKKEVFPRSPSVWCEYASCGSSLLLNHAMVSPSVSGKGRGSVTSSTDALAPIKGVKGMKRAANRLKALTKLKKLTQVPNEEFAKRKRIESLLGSAGIQSNNKNIAIDAAKALGQLKYHDEIVIKGLQEVIQKGKGKLLVYECAKSMILLGSWHDSTMDILTNHLKHGNKKVQEDILLTLKTSHDAHFIPKSSDTLISLSNALMDLLNDDDQSVAFNAALSLGHLCINTERTKWLLLDSLVNSSYATKYEALNVLVKQMNCQDNDVIDALLSQVSNANCWKHRMQAIDLLRDIGLKRLNQYGIKEVFEVLQKLLWNHSNKELRSKVVALLEDFGLRKEACANVLKRLGDKSESVRANSIVALVTLQMKSERELKILLDMFDLDSSAHVRSEVIKAFVDMKWNHPHVMRVLEDRQKANDVLAKKAMKAYIFLRNLST